MGGIFNLVDDPGRIQGVADSRVQVKCLKIKEMESLPYLESKIGHKGMVFKGLKGGMPWPD